MYLFLENIENKFSEMYNPFKNKTKIGYILFNFVLFFVL
jgi:hypothetical protein